MCKFCESITNRKLDVTLSSRSRLAVDNTCEFIGEDCSKCKDGCNEYFKIGGFESNGNTYINVDFYKEVGNIIIAPFSESIHINYCPYCGRKLSTEIKDFDDLHNHIIDVYNKDGSLYDWESVKTLRRLGVSEKDISKMLE